MGDDIFSRIAFDDRLVSPGREQARAAFETLHGVAPVSVRRALGRDVLVRIAREYHLGSVADDAENADVPGTESNPY